VLAAAVGAVGEPLLPLADPPVAPLEPFPLLVGAKLTVGSIVGLLEGTILGAALRDGFILGPLEGMPLGAALRVGSILGAMLGDLDGGQLPPLFEDAHDFAVLPFALAAPALAPFEPLLPVGAVGAVGATGAGDALFPVPFESRAVGAVGAAGAGDALFPVLFESRL